MKLQLYEQHNCEMLFSHCLFQRAAKLVLHSGDS